MHLFLCLSVSLSRSYMILKAKISDLLKWSIDNNKLPILSLIMD